jgi:hypothetical protein
MREYGGGEVGLELHAFWRAAVDEGDWSARNPGWISPRQSACRYPLSRTLDGPQSRLNFLSITSSNVKVAVWLEARRECVGRKLFLHKLCVVVISSSFLRVTYSWKCNISKKNDWFLLPFTSCIRYICMPFVGGANGLFNCTDLILT